MNDCYGKSRHPVDSPQARLSADDSIHLDCLRLVAEGWTIRDIASELWDATTAIEFALSDVCCCFNVESVDEAVAVAQRNGMLG